MHERAVNRSGRQHGFIESQSFCGRPVMAAVVALPQEWTDFRISLRYVPAIKGNGREPIRNALVINQWPP